MYSRENIFWLPSSILLESLRTHSALTIDLRQSAPCLLFAHPLHCFVYTHIIIDAGALQFLIYFSFSVLLKN